VELALAPELRDAVPDAERDTVALVVTVAVPERNVTLADADPEGVPVPLLDTNVELAEAEPDGVLDPDMDRKDTVALADPDGEPDALNVCGVADGESDALFVAEPVLDGREVPDALPELDVVGDADDVADAERERNVTLEVGDGDDVAVPEPLTNVDDADADAEGVLEEESVKKETDAVGLTELLLLTRPVADVVGDALLVAVVEGEPDGVRVPVIDKNVTVALGEPDGVFVAVDVYIEGLGDAEPEGVLLPLVV
jgi:hypothetical protein